MSTDLTRINESKGEKPWNRDGFRRMNYLNDNSRKANIPMHYASDECFIKVAK